jgi:DNA-binding NarL/FixJ family response regulator
MTVRVLLADDHAVLRDGLRSILESSADVEVVGEAETGREAVEMARTLAPDVVVMDIAMRDLNGIEATRQIMAENPKASVIALSTHSDRRYVLAMLEAGAAGYVLKASAFADLQRALESVCAGKRYLSSDITGIVIDAGIGAAAASGAPGHGPLGAREREVLQLLAEGHTSGEIALRLHISTHTVDTHRRNIMQKLDLHNIASLTKYAVREGLTSLED